VIAFMRRHDEAGEVYVAYSKRGKLCKVGSAKSAQNRIRSLNTLAYGGRSDWRLIEFEAFSRGAGWVEAQVQKRLLKYQTSGLYERESRWVECYELFDCTHGIATKSLREVADLC
jgi:hypothetical protein